MTSGARCSHYEEIMLILYVNRNERFWNGLLSKEAIWCTWFRYNTNPLAVCFIRLVYMYFWRGKSLFTIICLVHPIFPFSSDIDIWPLISKVISETYPISVAIFEELCLTLPPSSCKNLSLTFSVEHLLHRLCGVDALDVVDIFENMFEMLCACARLL